MLSTDIGNGIMTVKNLYYPASTFANLDVCVTG